MRGVGFVLGEGGDFLGAGPVRRALRWSCCEVTILGLGRMCADLPSSRTGGRSNIMRKRLQFLNIAVIHLLQMHLHVWVLNRNS